MPSNGVMHCDDVPVLSSADAWESVAYMASFLVKIKHKGPYVPERCGPPWYVCTDFGEEHCHISGTGGAHAILG